MSNVQGNVLLTAHIACRTFTGAPGAITDVVDRSACTTTDRDLGQCVVIIWKLQSGDVHLAMKDRQDFYGQISDIEGFVGFTHIGRLHGAAPGRRLLMCGTSSRIWCLEFTPKVSRYALGRRWG